MKEYLFFERLKVGSAKIKTLSFLILIVSLLSLFSCDKKDDGNSIMIYITGTVVEKGTDQPIADVNLTFTGKSGFAIASSHEDGFFSHQLFGSKTATLTAEKDGYVFEYTPEGSDSVQNFREFEEGTYQDLVFEMRKVAEN